MPRVRTSAQLVGKLVAKAKLAGEDVPIFEGVVLNRSYGCESPVVVELNGRAIVDHPRAGYRQHRNADVLAPCRKCRTCLRRRARDWAQRAAAEIAHAQRTWFVTLTLRPEMQYRSIAMARKSFAGCDELDDGHLFRRRVAVINAEITKWLKRVRKNSTARMRLVLVAEAHKSGDPHFHALVHECLGSAPILHRHITDAWSWGFSSAKLTDPGDHRAAWYVSKYLAKSALVRIRASARYGSGGTPDLSKVAEREWSKQQADGQNEGLSQRSGNLPCIGIGLGPHSRGDDNHVEFAETSSPSHQSTASDSGATSEGAQDGNPRYIAEDWYRLCREYFPNSDGTGNHGC